MKRELISEALNLLEERHIRDTAAFAPGLIQEGPERIVRMRKKRMITLALAAALLLALGVAAYAAWGVHTAKQHELKADLKIEEKNVGSYWEYDISEESDNSGAVLLSTVNDGESQRVFVDVSPVEIEDLERFPESVSFAWKIDGMKLDDGSDYWMTAGPVLPSDISVSGHEAIREAVLRDAYDEDTKTLTLACFISNNAIAQAQANTNSESVHLTLTFWDHQAQADAHVGKTVDWLGSQKSYGSVWFTPTEQEMRYFDFGPTVYRDSEIDKDMELVGLELTPFSAVWKVRYEDAAAYHRPKADWSAYAPWSKLEDRICIEAKLIFSDGSTFSTGGALTTPYENGVVNMRCGWGSAINVQDVQRIEFDGLVLWEADSKA